MNKFNESHYPLTDITKTSSVDEFDDGYVIVECKIPGLLDLLQSTLEKDTKIVKSARITLTPEAYESAAALADRAECTVDTMIGRVANRTLELLAQLEAPSAVAHARINEISKSPELSPQRRLGS